MRKIDEEILMFGLFVVLGNSILLMLKVENADVYMAFTILLYFLVSGLSSEIRRIRHIRIVDAVFTAVFIGLIIYRLLTITSSGG